MRKPGEAYWVLIRTGDRWKIVSAHDTLDQARRKAGIVEEQSRPLYPIRIVYGTGATALLPRSLHAKEVHDDEDPASAS